VINLKSGRKPTRAEKLFLKSQGLNPKEFLTTKKLADHFEFLHKPSGKLVAIRR
jgi:hypothetical protein